MSQAPSRGFNRPVPRRTNPRGTPPARPGGTIPRVLYSPLVAVETPAAATRCSVSPLRGRRRLSPAAPHALCVLAEDGTMARTPRRVAGTGDPEQDRLLVTLERLLALEATDLGDTLRRTCDLVAEALGADKVDVFLHDPATETLAAAGTSDTPLGRRQHALGLDRLPLANGGRPPAG